MGEDRSAWLQYDTCALLSEAEQRLPILVDQGTGDNFLASQLKTELLVDAAKAAEYPIEIRMQEGYDHSYFFIASFIGEHIAFHAKHMAG